MSKSTVTHLTPVHRVPLSTETAENSLDEASLQIGGAIAIIDLIYAPLASGITKSGESALECLDAGTLTNALHVALERLQNAKQIIDTTACEGMIHKQGN